MDMENNNDVQYLIDMLYDMIDSAKSMPMARDKCVIMREEALDIIEDIRGKLPVELKKAQELIQKRDEFVEKARSEAERIRRQAENDARTTVEESEITRIAQEKARQLIRQAGDRANGMIGVANEYTDDALRRTEEAIQMALEEIRESRARFRAVSNEKLLAQRAKLEEQRGDADRRR